MLSKRKLAWALASQHTAMVIICTVAAYYFATRLAPWHDPWFLLSLIVSYALYYFFVCCPKPQVFHNGGAPWQIEVLGRMQCLREGYYPTPYLVNANMQTLFSAMGRPSAGVKYRRERVVGVLEDGEILSLDWSMVGEDYRKFEEEEEKALQRAEAGGDMPFPTLTRAQAVAMSSSNSPTKPRGSGASTPKRRRSSEAVPGSEQRKTGSPLFKRVESTENADDVPHSTSSSRRSSNGQEASSPQRRSSVAADADGPKSRVPVIVLFHGLTGGSDDTNMHYLTKQFNERGWHVVIPIRRGCGEAGTLTVPKHYAYGDHENTTHIIDYIAKSMPDHPLYGCGISAGSNVMCNYLGTAGSKSKLLAGISVANGYEWNAGTAAIAKYHPVWDVIMSSLVNGTLFHRHATVYGVGASPHAVTDPKSPVGKGIFMKRTASLREYDEMVSRRLHGYDSLEEFYTRQSCVHVLKDIRVPVLFLNALDDPIAHHQLWPYKEVSRSNNLALVTTACGGHLGWAEGWWPFSSTKPTWMDRFCCEGLASLMAHCERLRTQKN